jgi:lipid A ethanolaminephosphotransferase
MCISRFTHYLRQAVIWRRSCRPLSPLLLAFFCALVLLLFANMSLWRGSFHAMEQSAGLVTGMLILVLAMLALYTALVYLLLWPGVGKVLLVVMFLSAAVWAYAMDAYGTRIDANMVGNALGTNWRELQGLMSWQLAAYVLLLGVLPSLLIVWAPIRFPRFGKQLLFKPLVFITCLLLAVVLLFANYQQMSAFGRNHRSLRYLINPWLPFYYSYDYFHKQALAAMPFKVIGQDAHMTAPLEGAAKPVLVFLVIGETARAQNFSLDGYDRDTNPELAKRHVISFRHVQSCGTETAVSVPCMFSPYTRKQYSREKALHTSNLLDVLKQAGVTVLWRDNNEGSQGMADRVEYQDVSRSKEPASCPQNHDHCYDTVLLYQLPQWLALQKGSLLVVLHMYGSHGPAYYKRYPKTFARFQPECKTNELNRCDHASLINSYDNTILYTDHVLASMIDFLKQQKNYNTAMLYLSDHGESLGEDGFYLHGMPWHIAPSQQRHIPFIWWMSQDYADEMQLSTTCLAKRVNEPLSQDDLFSSVLGMFAVSTKVYHEKLDFLAPCRGR